jgi:hypothetical protein
MWIEPEDGVSATLEVASLGAEDVPRTRTLKPAVRTEVPWADLGAGPGDILRLRVVARDAAGRIVETVPADGLARRVELPAVADAAVWTA